MTVRLPQRMPEQAVLRDRALVTLALAVTGRSAEVSALDADGIRLVAEGLEIHVPSAKGRPACDVVAHGQHPVTCPVRCWLAWKQAADIDTRPAFRPVDQAGRIGAARLGLDGCRRAACRVSYDLPSVSTGSS
ncbi:hypothetical protein [Streptomyces sp. Tu 3180]|uniref:hypothetical protein n=1 Tax=Streptomyces sp. Tu 3180 TaxID=2682611 RepID=UPI00135B21F7|nr:hypothetical protein [Streptomyces sp. Tu 3180]KAF3469972.1 hypothetical protein GL259_00050 [Streptomyces sp. Tu 3180]